MTRENFYRAFEDVHRGPRELIRGRLSVYQPFLIPFLKLEEHPAAVDLGCGRGEWLELLQDLGFDAKGIDLDDGMLEACRERSLSVTHGDGIAFLKTLPDSSLSVVSGFHIAEHITFNQLQTLVEQSLRVLRPAGLLILETPNPENVVVGTSSFYLDPTHTRPIPPLLLSFLPDYFGFARQKILRLQENIELERERKVGLVDVLAGVSPDYAVVAQKRAGNETMRFFDEAFGQDHGLSLMDLTRRYDDEILAVCNEVETQKLKVDDLAEWCDIHEQRQAESAARLRMLERSVAARELKFMHDLRKLRQSTDEVRALLDAFIKPRIELDNLLEREKARSRELEEKLDAIHRSTSWHVTKPLRGLKRFLTGNSGAMNWMVRSMTLQLKVALRPLVAKCICFVFARRSLRARLSYLLKKFPTIHQRFLRVAANTGAVAGLSLSGGNSSQTSNSFPLQGADGDAVLSCSGMAGKGITGEDGALSPRAQRVLLRLVTALGSDR